MQYNPSIVERAIGAAGPAATELATDALKPTLASALGFGGQPTTQSTGPAPTGGTGGPGVAVTGEGAAINPAAVVPVHTEHPGEFEGITSDVDLTIKADGHWWDVNSG